MSNIIDSIKLSGVTYTIQGSGGGGEGTVSALTETNPVALKTYTYYTATTIDTIYLISKFDSTFYNYYTMGGYLSDDESINIYTSGNENGITSVSASTAFTSTITDGIAEIKFVSPLTLKQIYDLRNRFIAYYFPPTPYTSGSTSEVVEGAVYDSLRKLSLDVLQKDGINDYYIYAADNGIGFNLRTDKNYYSGNLALASPTINFNGGKLNTQFSSSTVSQAVINNGESNYCTLFHSKSYDDITITFNPSYNGGATQANFTIYAQISEYQSVQGHFTYDIANNSISWSSSDWNTYFTVVDTLSTDYKLKIIANTGYKIAQFNSNECLIGGIDAYDPNRYITNLVTTTSNIHDGQEIIDDLYANKQDKLSAGTGINITDNVISATGGGGGNPTVELTQAQYDALVTAGTVQADTYYIITDAQAGDLTNYYTKTEVDNAITAATSTKQDTLVSGTNIKTINNTSILGSGNIDIQGSGGGKAIEAGRGISITTGETADTVSFDLPISAGTGTGSIVANGNSTKATGGQSFAEGYSTSATSQGAHSEGMYSKATNTAAHAEGNYTTASGTYSHAEGSNTKATGYASHAEGDNTAAGGDYSFAGGRYSSANTSYSFAHGRYINANNESEHSIGKFNVSNTGSTDADKTLFSVGNGTSNNARHNAFEIRQNGDIYLSLNGQDVKLQDQLGGSSITVDTALDSGSTNPVENRVIYNKIDEVEQVTAAALNNINDRLSEDEEVTAASLNAVNDALGGLKLQQLTAAEYNALSTKDASTLYIIVN